jgi:uncharacterized protein (DUF4415 family)
VEASDGEGVTTDPRASEKTRRELAQRTHSGAIEGRGEVLEPRRLDQLVSLRLDPQLISALRELATERQTTISVLLREAASRLVRDSRAIHGEVQITRVETGYIGSSPAQGPFQTSSSICVDSKRDYELLSNVS